LGGEKKLFVIFNNFESWPPGKDVGGAEKRVMLDFTKGGSRKRAVKQTNCLSRRNLIFDLGGQGRGGRTGFTNNPGRKKILKKKSRKGAFCTRKLGIGLVPCRTLGKLHGPVVRLVLKTAEGGLGGPFRTVMKNKSTKRFGRDRKKEITRRGERGGWADKKQTCPQKERGPGEQHGRGQGKSNRLHLNSESGARKECESPRRRREAKIAPIADRQKGQSRLSYDRSPGKGGNKPSRTA